MVDPQLLTRDAPAKSPVPAAGAIREVEFLARVSARQPPAPCAATIRRIAETAPAVDPQLLTREQVEAQLYRAGATHMALRVSGCWPAGFRSCMPEAAVDADDLKTAAPAEPRPAQPNSRQVDKHDEAYGWVNRLPWGTPVEVRTRKLVLDRMRISPKTGKPVFGWSALGRRYGLSHTWAKTLWLRAVDDLTAIANRPLSDPCRATWARIRAQSTAHGLGTAAKPPVPARVPALETA